MRNLVQYRKNGQGYSAIGSTISTLGSGYYDVTRDNVGAIVFVQKTLGTDRLLRLSDTKSDAVIAEIEHFWTIRERFVKLGLVHKRGFLLYGPPGSGKTSTIAIVAEKMIAAGGLVVNGSSAEAVYVKQALHDLREVEPDRPLVVTLEDVDTLLKRDETTWLSIFDGDASVSNVVFIATTNYPEKLDARIINRPSRFDRVVRVGMPDAAARRQYVEHCDREMSPVDVERLVDLTDGLSVAQIKEAIVGVRCFDGVIEDVVARLKSNEIANEKRAAKLARNRAFFERFHDACVAKLSPEQVKVLRDEVVGKMEGAGANGIVTAKSTPSVT